MCSPHHCQPHRRHPQPRVQPQTVTHSIFSPGNVLLPIFRHQNQPKKIGSVGLARNVPSQRVLGVRKQAIVEINVGTVEKWAAEGGIQKDYTRRVVKGGICSHDVKYLIVIHHWYVEVNLSEYPTNKIITIHQTTWFGRCRSEYLDEPCSPRIFPCNTGLGKLLFLQTMLELAYDVKFGVFYSIEVSSDSLPFLLPSFFLFGNLFYF